MTSTRPPSSARAIPTGYASARAGSMVEHVARDAGLQTGGAVTFDYGNNLRGQAADGAAWPRPSTIPASCRAYIRPLFCKGKGPFRWAALSGDPARHRRHRRGRAGTVPRQRGAARWIALAGRSGPLQGLPARICWLGYGERARVGLRFN